MKKLYQDLEMQVLLFEVDDIVTTSPNQKDDAEEDFFG